VAIRAPRESLMKKLSTRLLLTCAAIGVAGAVVCLPTIYLSLGLLGIAPPFYGFIVGVHVFPGVIAQSLFRRGGIALVTATLTGLACAPFSPMGIGTIAPYVFVGLLQEIPFAVTLYRYWRGWVYYLAAVIAGLGIGGVLFVVLASQHAAFWVQLVQSGAFVVSLLAFTAIGRVVASGLQRAGVGRGVALPVDRRHRRVPAVPTTA